nr:MAG TPA_asm: hypothetical protein [Caudoviricetes sp.]
MGTGDGIAWNGGYSFSSLFWVFMERAFAKSGWIPEKAKALIFFLARTC